MYNKVSRRAPARAESGGGAVTRGAGGPRERAALKKNQKKTQKKTQSVTSKRVATRVKTAKKMTTNSKSLVSEQATSRRGL